MRTAITILRHLFFSLSFMCILLPGKCQQMHPAKNFIGTGTGIGWTTTTIFWGLSAERVLLAKKNMELSVSGWHSFPHKFGNLVLLFGPSYSFRTSETSLLLNSFMYTSAEKLNTGFFFSIGAGAQYSNWKYDHGGNESFINPVGEIGFGLKWKLDGKMAMRWTNTMRLTSLNPDNSGGELMTTTTLAVGF